MPKDNTCLSANELIDQHADLVYRIALLHTKNKSDADDIFQEVFLRLVKYIHTLKDEEHAKYWLMRVTINCSKSHFTSAWRRNTVLYEKESDIQSDYEIQNSYEMQTQEDKELIYYAVKNLPQKYRSVIHLFYYEQLSIKEISAILHRKESTVKAQLSRGRNLLKEVLKGDF